MTGEDGASSPDRVKWHWDKNCAAPNQSFSASFHVARTPDRQLDAPDNNAPTRWNHDDTPQHFDNG
jgi:hypothetical protein